MRRKDREMGKEFGLEIIDKATFGILSISDSNGLPYALPLSIARDGDNLYFHSAKQGRKTDIINDQDLVSVSFVGEVEIPNIYSQKELNEIVLDSEKTALLVSKVFTTQFESTIAQGKIYKVNEEKERIHAMKLICEKYLPSKMKYFDYAIKSGLDKALVYRIEIDKLTAKRKKYDEKGEEMKWARMDL